ncbi:MAG TPA: methionine synthase [Burkholderiales bacterium]|nr:methionine synthase [Burkholderiales bacterium]
MVGSMPRPAWLVDDWYSIAANWRLSGTALSEGFDDATRLALADQEAAGIDIVCDGEQRRPTHHTYFLSHLDGVDFTTLKPKAMRGRRNTTDVPRVVGPVSVRGHSTTDDFRFLRRLTGKPIKATLPGPSTLVDGSYDEYYGDERALAFAFADALREEIRALAAAGCDIVQLDEPAVSRLPEKLHAWGVEAMDRAFEGVAVTSCVHVCYGYTSRQGGGKKEWKHGYDEILPALAGSRIEQFSLEFAEPKLPAVVLELLPGKTVQLGVINVGSTEIETPAQVAGQLRAALEILPVERIIAAPDCGCVALPRDVARAKLAAMVAGAGTVRAELGARR